MLSVKRVLFCGLFVALTFWPGAASAKLASFSIPINASGVDSGAISDAGAIILPPGGARNFMFSFSVPRDYLANTDMTVSVLFGVFPFGSTCTVRLAPTPGQSRKRRAGTFPPTLQVGGGNPVVSVVSANEFAKNFRIPSGTNDLKRGDAITLWLGREAGHITDNCGGDVFVTSIEVRYQAD